MAITNVKKMAAGVREVARRCEEWSGCSFRPDEFSGQVVASGEWPFLARLAMVSWKLDDLLACRCEKVWVAWRSLVIEAQKLNRTPMLWLQQQRGPLLVMVPAELEIDVPVLTWRDGGDPSDLDLMVEPKLVSWFWLGGLPAAPILEGAKQRNERTIKR